MKIQGRYEDAAPARNWYKTKQNYTKKIELEIFEDETTKTFNIVWIDVFQFNVQTDTGFGLALNEQTKYL